MMGGTNDVLQDVPTATTKANLSYMWADAKALRGRGGGDDHPAVPGIHRTLDPHPSGRTWDILNAWIRAQAAANGTCWWMSTRCWANPGTRPISIQPMTAATTCTPNLAGGHAIRDAVGEAILVPATSPTSYIPNPWWNSGHRHRPQPERQHRDLAVNLWRAPSSRRD